MSNAIGPYILVPVEEYEMMLQDLKNYELLCKTLRPNGVIKND
jgi:hypothetical protein